MDNYILEIDELSKRFNNFCLKKIKFKLPTGALMGLVGLNGAGKTTLLKIIMGLVNIDEGEVRLMGHDLIMNGPELRQHIAYIPDEPRFAPGMRLHGLKESYSSFFVSWNDRAWKKLMFDFDLDPAAKAETLSFGERTRFALTLALSRDANLLVMDEPTTGLDPVFRRELLQLLRGRLETHGAILFSTHITSDLETSADLVTFIRDGQIFLSQPREEILTSWGVVKGGLELLDDQVSPAFKGLSLNASGFEALVDDLGAAQERFNGKALVNQASLEDILVLSGRRNTHA